jgi:hypothetical protein
VKFRTPLLLLASFILALAGCSKHPQTVSFPGDNNLGVIDVSSGKPSVYTLADGRVCTVTATVLPDGKVRLTAVTDETTGSSKTQRTLVSDLPADNGPFHFQFDERASITVEFTGGPKHATSVPKRSDLGVIDLTSSMKPISRMLADGRACVVTPTILPDGNASLDVRIDDAKGPGETKVFLAPVNGRAYTFSIDSSTAITVLLRK